MITKQDCLLLLAELEQRGVAVDQYIRKTVSSSTVDKDVLKFINDNRPLAVVEFYHKLRKSYNDKKSKLYINLMNELDETKINDVLTTLASLQLQILLFGRSVQDEVLFYKHARLEELSMCLLDYARNYSLINCVQLLRLVKADIKALESISR